MSEVAEHTLHVVATELGVTLGEARAALETFAERLALQCLDDARVLGVTVRVDKPGALEAADGAGCELTYRR